MKCIQCGSNMKEDKSGLFPYASCGLSNVYLKGIHFQKCSNKECGEEEVAIPNIEGLHELLAQNVASQKNILRPEEIRYLRTHLGFSGADFAKVMGVTPETVSRWEKGTVNMKEASERLLRVLVLSKSGPFREYEDLKVYASISSKAPVKRVFKLQRSHWLYSKVA